MVKSSAVQPLRVYPASRFGRFAPIEALFMRARELLLILEQSALPIKRQPA
jgi:hypothetical protein